MFDYQTDPDFEDGPEGERQWRAWQEELSGELIRVAGSISAMEYYLIRLISRFDKHECWTGDGVKSLAHWLNWKCGVNVPVAREKIRVARCLRVLPEIDEAFRTGRISYSKARALTRVATPDNEALLLEQAFDLTTEHIEQLVRRFKKARIPGEYGNQHLEPYVVCHQDEEGMLHLHARLPVEDGVLVEKAIDRMVNRMRQITSQSERECGSVNANVDGSMADIEDREIDDAVAENTTKESGLQTKKVSAETSERRSGWHQFARQKARALVQVAEHYLASGSDADGEDKTLSGGDKYHVVVHVNVNEAHRDCRINQGSCTYLEEGRFLAPHIAKMLACDAARTTVLEDDQGNVLNVGRRSRIVPRAIELAVDIRDNHVCQYPNCHQRHYTDKHHVITWAEGGETDVRNLITLCRVHHVQQHEGKYHIERVDHDDSSYEFLFISRDGEVIQRGMDPQFPDCAMPEVDMAEQMIPTAETHPLPARNQQRSVLEFYRMCSLS